MRYLKSLKSDILQGFTKVSTYLSPGASRSNGAVNPDYTSTFVFPNDFSALIPIQKPQPTTQDSPAVSTDSENTGTSPTDSSTIPGTTPKSELFQSLPAGGECHVMCFSPHSDLSLPLMGEQEIQIVIREWMRLSEQLKYNLYVQVRETLGLFHSSESVCCVVCDL